MKPLLFIPALLFISTSLAADTLYRCDGADGVPLFANVPCDEHSLPLQLPEIGRIGSDDGGVLLRQRTEAMARIAEIPATGQGAAPSSSGLTFGQRMTLRQLEIRRDGLQRDVRNQALTPSFRKTLGDELALVKQRIRELEKQR